MKTNYELSTEDFETERALADSVPNRVLDVVDELIELGQELIDFRGRRRDLNDVAAKVDESVRSLLDLVRDLLDNK